LFSLSLGFLGETVRDWPVADDKRAIERLMSTCRDLIIRETLLTAKKSLFSVDVQRDQSLSTETGDLSKKKNRELHDQSMGFYVGPQKYMGLNGR
jgi:hypothetical protein